MGRNGSVRRSGSAGGSGHAAGPPTFTVNPADYRLMEEVGYGAHAVVYRAIFLPRNEVVAVKCLDLDQLNNNIVSTCDTPFSPSSYKFPGFSVAV
jgi:serine/threonine protein kinase